ncbi:MAG: hypothetical protein NZX77_14835 [Polyangiaceae bacterium]|nr:hypothetical protein [Polyangiaceae bacterium]
MHQLVWAEQRAPPLVPQGLPEAPVARLVREVPPQGLLAPPQGLPEALAQREQKPVGLGMAGLGMAGLVPTAQGGVEQQAMGGAQEQRGMEGARARKPESARPA